MVPAKTFRGLDDPAANMTSYNSIEQYGTLAGVYPAERHSGNKLRDILSGFVLATPVSTIMLSLQIVANKSCASKPTFVRT